MLQLRDDLRFCGVPYRMMWYWAAAATCGAHAPHMPLGPRKATSSTLQDMILLRFYIAPEG